MPYKQISAAKLAQALDFGAMVVEVGDSFDEAFGLLRQIARPNLASILFNSVNPFRIEGQKTIVAELLEQRAWRPPDYIVVPGGNLGNSSAIGKGLRELKEMGFIEKAPHLVIVQAAGANPFYQTLRANSPDLIAVDSPTTEATAIRIGHPANWKKAKRALDWAGGFVESVTDEEIFEAKRVLAEDGVGCEPASAATVAGVRKLVRAGKIERHADIVCVLTGNQLKDTQYIMRHRTEDQEDSQRIQGGTDPCLPAQGNRSASSGRRPRAGILGIEGRPQLASDAFLGFVLAHIKRIRHSSPGFSLENPASSLIIRGAPDELNRVRVASGPESLPTPQIYDEHLRQEVRFLTTRLGEIVREQSGPEVFAAIGPKFSARSRNKSASRRAPGSSRPNSAR